MKEFLENKRGALALTLALGLGGSAIGGAATAGATEKPKAPAVAKHHEAESSGITVHAKYFRNGTRELVVKGGSDGVHGANIFEFCDGHDLVEETLQDGLDQWSVNQSTAISRSVDYPGCADGKLTPSDFQLHPNQNSANK